MIVCVHDANILIDLAKSGLLDRYARLGWTTFIPDLVLREVQQDVEPWVQSGVFQIRTFDAEGLLEILALRGTHSTRISLQDASALHLANKLGAALITGDGALRKAAERDKRLQGWAKAPPSRRRA
jgi:rRNA-processing protein FCF1